LSLPPEILLDQPIPTWFGVGGRARRMARPQSVAELIECIKIDPNLRILGDGANLLVADEGVSELVVVLNRGEFIDVQINDTTGHVIAGAGANLPKLITETARRGLSGIETLGGIPATLGGAVVMNAGGTFGQIGDCVHAVHAIDRAGNTLKLPREQLTFSYRHTDLGGHQDLIITSVELSLRPHAGDHTSGLSGAEVVRAKLKEVMAYKSKSQPMSASSAGCCFKNPTLSRAITMTGPDGAPTTLGEANQRVSAGMLIDRAGCKGLRIGNAEVSPQHANFFIAHPNCTATDIIALIRSVRQRVGEAFGVNIEPEVKIWGAEL
jgi:UDP-N-acetylmuramate dehydrogenase